MEFMNSIAAMSMSLSAAKLQQSYSISLSKKAMDTQELAVQEMLEMMPETPAPVESSSIIDVYA